MIHSDRPGEVNEHPTISASKVIAISWKKTWKIICKQVLYKCVHSCAWFLNQNGLNFDLIRRIVNEATWIENISAENILILLFEFIVLNTRPVTRKVRFGTAVRSPSSRS